MNDAEGTPGVFAWYGEPVFSGTSWVEDDLHHLTIDELDLLAAAPSQEDAACKLGCMVLDLLVFLSSIPDREITEHELDVRNLILQHMGPVFVRHQEFTGDLLQRTPRVAERIRCWASGRLPGRRGRGLRASRWQWERQGQAPSTPGASVAASSA